MTLKEKKNLPEKVFNEMFSTITGEHPTKWIENYTKEEPKEKRSQIWGGTLPKKDDWRYNR